MAAMGVSRTVVREAVSALRAEGLVVTRQGLGAFVAVDASRVAFRIASEGTAGSGADRRRAERDGIAARSRGRGCGAGCRAGKRGAGRPHRGRTGRHRYRDRARRDGSARGFRVPSRYRRRDRQFALLRVPRFPRPPCHSRARVSGPPGLARRAAGLSERIQKDHARIAAAIRAHDTSGGPPRHAGASDQEPASAITASPSTIGRGGRATPGRSDRAGLTKPGECS